MKKLNDKTKVNESKSKLRYKGRHVSTLEEIAQRDCPFPDESEWVAELERFHAEREKCNKVDAKTERNLT
ncbi:MAG TPA: hypothetical protein VKX17_15090 [Planctomycetota bacterium]|nr:hypothetical protein [Planctomycetota bacterium]